MKIPQSVDRQNRTKAARASARLRFMLRFVAVQHTHRASMRALGELVGLDHSTLSTYIRVGKFSESAAKRICDKVGHDTISVEMLVNPLSLPLDTELPAAEG